MKRINVQGIKMKSIKSRLIVIIAVFTSIMLLSLGAVYYINALDTVTNEVYEALQLVAAESAKLVASEIDTQLTFLATAAQNAVFDSILAEKKLKYMESEAQRMGYQVLGVVDLNGKALRSDGIEVDVNDREFFVLGKDGKPNVSDVLIDKVTGKPIIIYAAPIMRNGIVTGVLYGVRDGNELSRYTNEIVFGKSGYAYIINDEGTTLAHPDSSLVMNFDNIIKRSEEDRTLKQLADLHLNMIAGETGVGQYSYNNEKKIAGYTPIPGSNWSLAVVANVAEILSHVDNIKNQMLLLGFFFVAVGVAGAIIIGKLFADPISMMTSILERFADYDLTFDSNSKALKYLKRNDEIGKIANAIAKMQYAFSRLIKQTIMSSEMVGATSQELSASIQEISKNAQNQASTTEEVSSSMEEMTANISVVNDNMQTAAKDIGAISQAMAESDKGITDNTRNLIEINASLSSILNALNETRQSIHLISEKSKSASQEAQGTVALAEVGKRNLDKTVTQMTSIQDTILNLSKVIYGLGESANQIGDITDLIKDVAEQTNLLALNASIEAARAGEHGKGFAVVAQAIGNLADESQNATKEITKVIKNIQMEIGKAVASSEEGTRVVESGTLLVKDTSDSLEKIFEAIQKTSDVINEITAQMDKQSQDVNDIYSSSNEINHRVDTLMAAMKKEAENAAGIKEKLASLHQMINEISRSMEQQSAAVEQVSCAVNDNAAGIEEISAGSEEIARSAEELANSAQQLIEQVQKFKI
ncbi:MAG TPA: hypothetical protein GX505_02755 [Clostridiales bacterium]|nr:hypothetical protein [Clostridiales bacterium]